MAVRRSWVACAFVVSLVGCPTEPAGSGGGRATTPPAPYTSLADRPATAPVATSAPPPPAPAPTPPADDLPGWVGLVYGAGRGPMTPGGAAILVKNVVPGSPAAEAGLQPGEGITRVEGREAPGPDYLQGVLDARRPGDAVRLQVVTLDGARRDVTVEVVPFDTTVLLPRALAKGAALLAGRQRDGGWTRKGSEELGVDVPLTALCVRALVELPEPVRAAQAAAIDTGVALLLAHRSEEGAIVGAPDRAHYRTYATTLTLQALARRGGHEADVAALQRWLVAAQLDDDDDISDYDFGRFGAWNYFDHNRPATIRADVSATAYAAQALALSGLDPRSRTAAQALTFLERAQNLPRPEAAEEEQPLLDGGFAFGPRDSKAGRQVFSSGRIVFRSYGSATADGLRALLWLGVARDDPRVEAALAWLGARFSTRVNPGFPSDGDGLMERGIYFYYLDALTDALSRAGRDALAGPGGEPVRWRDEVARRLVSLQRPDGSWAGDSAVMHEDDPAQATAFALLALSRCGGGP